MARFQLQLDLQLFSQEKNRTRYSEKRGRTRVKKGQVARSMELPAAFILLVSFMSFYMLGGFMKERLIKLFTTIFFKFTCFGTSIRKMCW